MNQPDPERLQRDLDRITAALRSAGYELQNFEEFVWGRRHFYKTLPLLLDLFSEVESDHGRAALARSLQGHRLDAELRRRVVDAFERAPAGSEAQLLLGYLIRDNARRFATDELLRLARDPRHGRSRGPVAWGLGKGPRTPEVVATLVELVADQDPTVRGYAVRALGLLRAAEARDAVAQAAASDEPIQRLAAQALGRIDAAG